MNSNSIPQWLTAIGTILTVIVALFQKRIRDLINKPKIKIRYIDNDQCKVELSSDAESSDNSKEIRIRVILENEGNYIANHATMQVDEYYQKRGDDDSYMKVEFTPIEIKDFCGSKSMSIVPHLKYYYDVASIRQHVSMNKDGELGSSKQFYKLNLIGLNTSRILGKGTFIIPLKFYATRINSYIAYLKIYWNSDVYTKDRQYLNIKVLSQTEFSKLNIQ